MSDPAAIRAVLSEYQMVKTRGVVVIKLELPLEQWEAATRALGFPQPGAEQWVAVARLQNCATQPDGLATPDRQSVDQGARSTVSKDLARSLAGRQRYLESNDMEKAQMRAVLLCRDERFQRWIESRDPAPRLVDEDEAAAWLRVECGVGSRSEIATNEDAYLTFLAIETSYKIDVGLLPAPR